MIDPVLIGHELLADLYTGLAFFQKKSTLIHQCFIRLPNVLLHEKPGSMARSQSI